MLKNDHRDQKRIVIQACWSSFRIFHSYNAIIDPMIDCLALVSKPIAVKAAKYQVADIIPLAGWKNGVVIFTELRADGQEREDVPMLIADLGVQCDIVLGRRWLEESHMQLDCNMGLEPPSSVSLSCDRIEQVSLGDQEPIGQKSHENMTASPEVYDEDLSARQGEIDYPLDELNEEDACQSRIEITGDRCSQPLVRLPGRDDVQLYRLDDNFVAGIPEAPVVTSRENWIVTDEDMVIFRPLVQLPGCRRREEFGENTLSLHAEEVLRHQCQDAKNICQKDTLSLSSSFLSPLSPLLEEANEKWPCHHFLGLDPAQEASLVVEAWNEMLNSCYNDSISSEKDGLTRPSGHRHEVETENYCWSEAVNGDLKAYERGPDRPPDELNNKDSYRSRIPIMDDQCFRPRVRLSWINGHRFSRWDNDNHFSEVPRLLMTTSKDLMMDEDIASGPTVRLLGYRQQDDRKDSCRRDTGQAIITRTLPPEASEDSNQRDDPIAVTSVLETCREEANGQKSREGVPPYVYKTVDG